MLYLSFHQTYPFDNIKDNQEFPLFAKGSVEYHTGNDSNEVEM